MSRASSHLGGAAIIEPPLAQCADEKAHTSRDRCESHHPSAIDRNEGSARGSVSCTCIVCDALSDNDDMLGAQGHRPDAAATACESLVDSVGFCAHHGSLFERQCAKWPARSELIHAATQRVIELFDDEKRNAERLLEMFFVADRSCPWCKHRDQQLARQIHRISDFDSVQDSSRWLCFPHYRRVVYVLKSGALPALVRAQIRLLRAVTSAIGPLDHKARAQTTAVPIATATLHWALRVVAGDAWPGGDEEGSEQSRRERIAESPELADEASAAAIQCPVCADILDAELRWHSSVQTAARLGHDLWTVFPTCPPHIALCTRSDDRSIGILTARYGASVQLASLERGLESLARDDHNRVVAAKSVFYRRQSPAYILGQQRKMISSAPRCPGCERANIAQERAVVRLAQKLGTARSRGATDTTSRLCLKHFALVYVLMSDGEPRAMLIRSQVQRLRELGQRLAAARAAGDPTAVGSALRDAIGVWRTVMRQLSHQL